MSIHIVANGILRIRGDGNPGTPQEQQAIIAQELLQQHLTAHVSITPQLHTELQTAYADLPFCRLCYAILALLNPS